MTFNVQSRSADEFDGTYPYPIPDGYMWTGPTGRDWTANGTGLILNVIAIVGRVWVYEL